MNKRAELLALAKLRKSTRWNGYKCIGDYHRGAYECDFVSPYTKTASALDSEIMLILQDWSSDDALKRTLDDDARALGYTPGEPTNRNLAMLLDVTFGLTLSDTYGTNLFPFIKFGGVSSRIPQRDLLAAARQFALPQIRVVSPRLVVCLGLVTFNAIRQACELHPARNLTTAIDSHFNIGSSAIWCQAHTGARGRNNRNRGGVDRVTQDWQRMKVTLREV